MFSKRSLTVKGAWLSSYGVLAVFVLLFALIGAYMLVRSRAATVSYSQFLNYQSAAQTAGVTNIPVQINSLGQQTVSQVAPGAKLTYLLGGKITIANECYYVQVLPLKGGGTTATVEFTGQGNSITRKLTYDANQAGNYQKICVSSGSQTLKDYNIFNKSPAEGPALLVYEDIISQ